MKVIVAKVSYNYKDTDESYFFNYDKVLDTLKYILSFEVCHEDAEELNEVTTLEDLDVFVNKKFEGNIIVSIDEHNITE